MRIVIVRHSFAANNGVRRMSNVSMCLFHQHGVPSFPTNPTLCPHDDCKNPPSGALRYGLRPTDPSLFFCTGVITPGSIHTMETTVRKRSPNVVAVFRSYVSLIHIMIFFEFINWQGHTPPMRYPQTDPAIDRTERAEYSRDGPERFSRPYTPVMSVAEEQNMTPAPASPMSDSPCPTSPAWIVRRGTEFSRGALVRSRMNRKPGPRAEAAAESAAEVPFRSMRLRYRNAQARTGEHPADPANADHMSSVVISHRKKFLRRSVNGKNFRDRSTNMYRCRTISVQTETVRCNVRALTITVHRRSLYRRW